MRGCRPSFPIVHMLIVAGDIRDQSLKLSEVAPNFGSPQIFGVRPRSCTHILIPATRHAAYKSFVGLLPLALKLLAHIR